MAVILNAPRILKTYLNKTQSNAVDDTNSKSIFNLLGTIWFISRILCVCCTFDLDRAVVGPKIDAHMFLFLARLI